MSESHDLWEDAREATREDVHRIFATRERTCPSCGKTAQVAGALCPHCRAAYTVREKGFRITPRKAGIAAGVLLLVLVGAVMLVPGWRRTAADQRREAAAKAAAFQRAENARIEREQRPVRASGPVRRPGEGVLDWRARQVTAGEAAIAVDARRRIAAGTMDGPVGGVECDPFPTTPTRISAEKEPGIPRNRYECFVYERKVALPELNGKPRVGLLGVPWWLVIDYRTSGMVFCKITPRAGEAGFDRTGVTVPPPCRDPLRSS